MNSLNFSHAKLSIGIFGASGKFGKAIASLCLADPRFSLKAALVHPKSEHLGADVGALLTQKPTGLLFTEKLNEKVDLLIDASLPDNLLERLSIATKNKTPLVVGTTGLSDSELQKIEEASQQIPLFFSPNFSIGIALLKKFAKEASRYFPIDAHIDLIETHHALKKDAPSGTALLLSDAIQKASPERSPVSIHPLRSGKIIGEHTLLFNTAEERLTLSHEAHHRDVFARGALAAALFLSQKNPGLYKMEDLIGS